MKEGEEVPRIKFEREFLLIETFMQLSVGNSELFSFDVPKPSTIFFFQWEDQKTKWLLKVIGFKEERRSEIFPTQVSFCILLCFKGRN